MSVMDQSLIAAARVCGNCRYRSSTGALSRLLGRGSRGALVKAAASPDVSSALAHRVLIVLPGTIFPNFDRRTVRAIGFNRERKICMKFRPLLDCVPIRPVEADLIVLVDGGAVAAKKP